MRLVLAVLLSVRQPCPAMLQQVARVRGRTITNAHHHTLRLIRCQRTVMHNMGKMHKRARLTPIISLQGFEIEKDKKNVKKFHTIFYIIAAITQYSLS